ncbi:MAG TPA: hypothetical protein VF765_18485 [Polyangiaceae bacterium]
MHRIGFWRAASIAALVHACGCNIASPDPPAGWGDDGGGSASAEGDGGAGAAAEASAGDNDGGAPGNPDGGRAPGHGEDAGSPSSPETGVAESGAPEAGSDADGGTGRPYATGVLVFTGDGTWGTEIVDLEAMLDAHGVTYQEATSAQLDAMSAQDMATFGVIYIPGGEGGTEAGDTLPQTHANLRTAVQQLGVSYVGFCAGAFVAVAPAPTGGGDVSYGFGVVDGPVLDYYTGPDSDQTYEQTLESYPDGTTENILWYGGPVTPEIGVIARYPTGDAAISEIWSGKGLVLIGGVHPDLSQASLDALGVVPDTPAQDIAWKIMQAALTQQPLPTF